MIRQFKFLLLMLLSLPAFATMQVERTVLHFQPGDNGRQDVEVRNPTSEPIYVQVELLQVANPGDENESRDLIVNPKDAGFLVTPNKLVLPPGGLKRVRFVNLIPAAENERVYRVNLKPVSSHERDAEKTAIKVLVGYQLLVFVQPADPKPMVEGIIKGNKLLMTNKGNTNVMMQRGVQCKDPKKKTECYDLLTKRLYPGNRWEQEIKYDAPIEYLMSFGLKNESILFSPNEDAVEEQARAQGASADQ